MGSFRVAQCTNRANNYSLGFCKVFYILTFYLLHCLVVRTQGGDQFTINIQLVLIIFMCTFVQFISAQLLRHARHTISNIINAYLAYSSSSTHMKGAAGCGRRSCRCLNIFEHVQDSIAASLSSKHLFYVFLS